MNLSFPYYLHQIISAKTAKKKYYELFWGTLFAPKQTGNQFIILSGFDTKKSTHSGTCNCHNKSKCPLNGSNIVYEGQIT